MAKKVPIALDKERHLLWDGNAMARWSKEAKRKISDVIDLAEMGYDELITMVWACLCHEDHKLPKEQVGAMIDADNLDAVYLALVEAVSPLSRRATNAEPSPESNSESKTSETTSA